MKIDSELVAKLAHLARLDLRPEECERLRGQLEGILAKFDEIRELDVSGVEASTRYSTASCAPRADEPAPSLAREKVLANAPEAFEGCFRVPRVI